MLGARTAAWAKSGGGVPTARDYVQDGLIAMWDGIENAAWGVHDPSATTWKDLAGNNDATPVDGTYSWESDSFVCNGIGLVSAYSSDFQSVEVVVRVREDLQTTTYAPIFGTLSESNAKGVFWLPSLNYLRFYNGTSNSLPTTETELNGTFSAVSVSPSTIVFKDAEIKNTKRVSYWNIVGFQSDVFKIGGSDKNNKCFGYIKSVRVYNRVITSSEILHNYEIDKARFNLP